MFNQARKDEPSSLQAIPLKANFVLKVVLCMLFFIALRIWHLGVIQHDKKKEEAFHPRRKVLFEPAPRGTIRDRFNAILAINKIEYRLAIVYSQFRDVPAWISVKGADGKKERRYLRREYIHKLSQVLGDVLQVEAARLEDIIHSHASLNNSIPLVIKQGLSEQDYFRLKAMEKDWLGIQVQRVPKRHYPKGKVGCDVVGYLGPISKEKYSALIAEIRTLQEYVAQKEEGQDVEFPVGITSFREAKERLLALQEKAYAINDSVGVLGIEASFEEELRGYAGKRIFFADAKGNCLRELPGSCPATSGKRILLSISSELQEFAEQLLAASEQERQVEHAAKKKAKEPVMRGGAIVAIDPHTGEVLALASYPRFDPNDFIRARSSFFDEEASLDVLRWIESDGYLAKIWDGSKSLKREVYDAKSKQFSDLPYPLSWEDFLELLLPINTILKEKLGPKTSIKELVDLQRDFFLLHEAYPAMPLEQFVELDSLKVWFNGFENVQEKLLYVDLSRLVLWHEDFSDALLSQVGHLSIEEFRMLSREYSAISMQLKKRIRKSWKKSYFAAWRKDHEKEFIKEMRLQERKRNQYAKPYLDYVDKEEERQFQQFWMERQKELWLALGDLEILHSLKPAHTALTIEDQVAFYGTLRSFSDLDFTLLMKYSGVVGDKGKDIVRAAMKVFSPGHARSFAYRHAAIQGSLFKLVTAYAGLKQRFHELKGKIEAQDLHLFEIIDKTFKDKNQTFVGNFMSGKPIPQLYKGGRIPKSLSANIGKVDLARALEYSSNPYFSLLAGDYLEDPEQLISAAKEFGFGSRTGILLPLEASGKLPNDLHTNKTGLYSCAIGQHTLLTTPLQSSVMLSAIANGGHIVEPQIVNMVIGRDPPFEQKEVKKRTNYPYKESLLAVGIDFPLFLKGMNYSPKNEVERFEKKDVREVFLPTPVRDTLLEGLKRVISHIHEDKTGALRRLARQDPEKYAAFKILKNEFIGKSSTAESQEKIGATLGRPSVIYNHTWFGGISFDEPHVFASPDLVVVVYLRYRGYGREVAPFAAQMVRKWREIKQAHEESGKAS